MEEMEAGGDPSPPWYNDQQTTTRRNYDDDDDDDDAEELLRFENPTCSSMTNTKTNNTTTAAAAAAAAAARYKLMSPARLPITRSPCLTIPPGLSPTTLLDSPVLLSNMKAEPSPTTGSFNKPQIIYDTVASNGLSSPRDTCNNNPYDGRSSGTFEFKPHVRSSSGSVLSSLGPMACGGLNNQQSESFGQEHGQFQTTNFSPALSAQTEQFQASSRELALSVATPNSSGYMVASRVTVPAEVASEGVMRKQVLDSEVQETQSDHKETSHLIAAERSSEDGYNWRKYGQKHVKGCEFPRSYYKCTHPNCQVKKQLERSHDGHITEIIYKGKHDHPKPQPNRRMAVGTIVSVQEEGSDRFSSVNNVEDKYSNAYAQTYNQTQPNGSSEYLAITASDDNGYGTGVQSNGIINEIEDDDDDPESKRRKKDGAMDVTLMGKATREPRVVVQTLSEVDILDDGYRWRKYGQKVVKGNPNPRSYYKCTNAGCPVRKHVERASHDPKAVITTYEGKHNHDVPAARASAHDTAGPTLYHTAPNSSMLRTRSEEIDTISLDLGVGIGSSPENRFSEMQQKLDAEPPIHSYPYFADPGSSKMLQGYSGGLNGGANQYGTRPRRKL